MKRIRLIALIVLVFPLFAGAQTLDDKLAEIDAYAKTVIDTWKDSGRRGRLGPV